MNKYVNYTVFIVFYFVFLLIVSVMGLCTYDLYMKLDQSKPKEVEIGAKRGRTILVGKSSKYNRADIDRLIANQEVDTLILIQLEPTIKSDTIILN